MLLVLVCAEYVLSNVKSMLFEQKKYPLMRERKLAPQSLTQKAAPLLKTLKMRSPLLFVWL